jgi:hypothetical protein
MNPQDSESQIKERQIIEETSEDDLGVFVLGDYCNEIEQIFRGVYYCFPICVLIGTGCIICYYIFNK